MSATDHIQHTISDIMQANLQSLSNTRFGMSYTGFESHVEDRRARHAAQKVAESRKDDIANFLFVDSSFSNIRCGRGFKELYGLLLHARVCSRDRVSEP